MLKPIQFVKQCNVNGPLYQVGEVAGFMPELAAQLIADGSAREPITEALPPVTQADPAAEVLGTFGSFPQRTAGERQAARKGKR